MLPVLQLSRSEPASHLHIFPIPSNNPIKVYTQEKKCTDTQTHYSCMNVHLILGAFSQNKHAMNIVRGKVTHTVESFPSGCVGSMSRD